MKSCECKFLQRCMMARGSSNVLEKEGKREGRVVNVYLRSICKCFKEGREFCINLKK